LLKQTLGVLGVIAALVAIPSFAYFLWDRYRPVSFDLIRSENPPFFAKFYSPTSALHGHVSVCIFGMELINNSGRTVAVRDVSLRYEVEGKSHTIDSHVLLTTLIHAPLEHKDVQVAVMDVKKAQIILMGWRNLRTVLYENPQIEDGGIIRGSACFVISQNVSDKDISNMSLVVRSYKDQKSAIALNKLSPNSDGFIIRNEQFPVRNGEVLAPPVQLR